MTRIDRALLAELLRTFGLVALVLVTVYWANRAVSLFDRVISEGQSLALFFELSLLSLPILVRVVLPIAAFVAALLVTHRLIRDNELLVLQAAGVAPWRLARAFVIFGLVVAALLVLLMHHLIPQARARLAARHAELAQNITAGLLREGVFQHPAEGLTAFVARIDPDGGLHGIFLSDARSLTHRVDYTAESALIVPDAEGPKLVLLNGLAQHYDQSGRLTVLAFADFTFDLSPFVSPAGRNRQVQELPTRALLSPTPEILAETGASPAQLRHELWVRMVGGLSAPAVALAGFAALVVARFSRLSVVRPVIGAVVLVTLGELLNNLIARHAMREEAFAPLTVFPSVLVIVISVALLLWGGRRRRMRRVT